MSTYTVCIEASADGQIWQAMMPAETVTDDGTAADVAEFTAANQTIAEGENWRVRVWDGADADTATEPAAEYYAITAPDRKTPRDQRAAAERMATQGLAARPGAEIAVRIRWTHADRPAESSYLGEYDRRDAETIASRVLAAGYGPVERDRHAYLIHVDTARRIQAIIDRLNAYQGYDIWGVVILRLDDYDEARTAQLDTGKNDRFALTSGAIIRYGLGSFGGSAHSPHVPGWYVES